GGGGGRGGRGGDGVGGRAAVRCVRSTSIGIGGAGQRRCGPRKSSASATRCSAADSASDAIVRGDSAILIGLHRPRRDRHRRRAPSGTRTLSGSRTKSARPRRKIADLPAARALLSREGSVRITSGGGTHGRHEREEEPHRVRDPGEAGTQAILDEDRN